MMMHTNNNNVVEDYGDENGEDEAHNLTGGGGGNNKSSSTTGRRFCCRRRFPTRAELWEKDRRLLRSLVIIIVLFNIPFGRYVLYPFIIFSTWIHEMCHGMTALLLGGKVEWLRIFSNGSGLARTLIRDKAIPRVLVASAGYTGTAILGGILLLFRRTYCRIGLFGLGLLILLSCACLVRNIFGLVSLITIGVILLLCGYGLSNFWAGELYALLSSMCCLNAITSIEVLYGTKSQEIAGQTQLSDAVAVAKVLKVVPYWVCATVWLCLALLMITIGLVFVVEDDDSQTTESKNNQNANHLLHDLEDVSAIEMPSIVMD